MWSGFFDGSYGVLRKPSGVSASAVQTSWDKVVSAASSTGATCICGKHRCRHTPARVQTRGVMAVAVHDRQGNASRLCRATQGLQRLDGCGVPNVLWAGDFNLTDQDPRPRLPAGWCVPPYA